MSTKRKAISTVLDRAVKLYVVDGKDIIVRDAETNKMVATLGVDDLFDKNGNRFVYDLFEEDGSFVPDVAADEED